MTNAEARAIIQKYDRLIKQIANKAARTTRIATHDAEDFFAVGCEAAIHAVSAYVEGPVPEVAWVARLVRQAVRREAQKARKQGFRRTNGEAPILVQVDDIPAHVDDELDRERLAWVRDHERVLTGPERSVIQAIFSGMSGVAIADARGVSKQRIDQLKTDAIEKLRRFARLTFRSS
jgi:RNA polymerase sigma factor (sigma-70 family)